MVKRANTGDDAWWGRACQMTPIDEQRIRQKKAALLDIKVFHLIELTEFVRQMQMIIQK